MHSGGKMERAGLKVNTNIRNRQVYVKNHRSFTRGSPGRKYSCQGQEHLFLKRNEEFTLCNKFQDKYSSKAPI